MAWNLDWLEFESYGYQDSLRHRVREAYNAAYRVLEDGYKEAKEKLEQDLKASKDDEDRELNCQIIWHEEDRWREQQEALAAMALSMVASLTKSFLDEQKNNMSRTHPPDRKGYSGASELQRRITEYRARFGVDLEKLEYFETVREVELARNSCLHNGCFASEDYKKLTKQRLLNERENIDIAPKQLDTIIDELSRFADSLGKAMKDVRRSAKPSS